MPLSASTSLALHALGLIVIYSGYSLYQEKILKTPYGPNGLRFGSSAILVLCNRLFSMLVGLSIIAYKSRCADRDSPDYARSTFRARLRPASPILAYAAVAACNFAATFCQYEALRHVSFTTQALAKCCKMAPVLIVGRVVYKKRHAAKAWVATCTVLFGCAVYLSSHSPASSTVADRSFADGLIGTLFIFGYLLFDGLTSTTQERVFGRAPSSTDPFGHDSPVLDQMIWVNLFAIVISTLASAATFATTLIPSISLIASDPVLAIDIIGLSATSACGLIVLLNTIAAFGALTSSTVMTVRQFLSILVNAGVFGNMASVGTQGWIGVFYVAAGIFIKMDRRFDPPRPPKQAAARTPAAPEVVFDADKDEEKAPMLGLGLASGSPPRSSQTTPLPPYAEFAGAEAGLPAVAPVRKHSLFRQYGPPMIVPLFVGVIVGLLSGDVPQLPPLPTVTVSWAPEVPTVETYQPEPVIAALAGSEQDEALDSEYDAAVPVAEASQPESVDVDEAALQQTVAVIEGGQWAKELHSAVSPDCEDLVETTPYPGTLPRTALATFPRSGNSYIRGLIERATGYQTSSMYCDRSLQKAFHGECNHTSTMLVKSHYPAVKTHPLNDASHWTQFDRQVHLVRNPLDSIFSYNAWQVSGHDHEHKTDIDHKFGSTKAERERAILLAKRYKDHDNYWRAVPLLTHTLIYEHLRAAPLPALMDAIAFILPSDELPSLERLACTVELNEDAQAYHSNKRQVFSSWNMWDPTTRREVLQTTAAQWCRYGFETMAQEAGLKSGIDCNKLSGAPRRLAKA